MNIFANLSKTEEERIKEETAFWKAKKEYWLRMNKIKMRFLNAQKRKGKED